jgi:hypothetical protein
VPRRSLAKKPSIHVFLNLEFCTSDSITPSLALAPLVEHVAQGTYCITPRVKQGMIRDPLIKGSVNFGMKFRYSLHSHGDFPIPVITPKILHALCKKMHKPNHASLGPRRLGDGSSHRLAV